LIGPLGKWVSHPAVGDIRAYFQAEQFVGGCARQLALDSRTKRRLHVAGHARDDHTGAAGLDHTTELVDGQRDTQQVDRQYRLRRGLLRRKPCGMNDRRNSAGRMGRLGDCGYRAAGGDVDFSGQHLMTVVSKRACCGVQACRVDVRQHDRPSGSNSAGDRHPHSADADDDQNLVV
jgi:hypothetical protein